MCKEIGIKNSHKWTRYAALSLVLAVAPVASTAAAAGAARSTGGAAVVAASSSSPATSTVAPDSSKWT